MRRPYWLALLLLAPFAVAQQAPWGRADVPVSSRDRVYAAEQYSNTVSVIDPSSNKLLGTIRLGDPQPANLSPLYRGQLIVHGLGFSPDGRTLAVGGAYGVVELIHIATGRSLATLSTPESAPHHSTYYGVKPIVARWPRLLAFSEDNETLLAADWGGWVRVWRAPALANPARTE